jgi:GNAT superfamily N-acetyltransferase/biotin operon repressor
MQEKLQAQILNVLRSAPSRLQMEELVEKLGLTRHTIAKYLEVLRAGGKIDFQRVGRSKLWKEISATTNIRLLRIEDIEDILKIVAIIQKTRSAENPELMGYVKDAATYHLQQTDPLLNLGAEIDGKLVGFALAEIRLWEFGRSEKTGWIKMLEVDSDYQRRGIGQKLFEVMLNHFQRLNVKKIRTLIDWYDGNLISFFKSLGFNFLTMIALEKEVEK